VKQAQDASGYNRLFQQRDVELPSGYKSAWVNANGEYIVTDRLNFDREADLDDNW
jgi:hypothetical protein